MLAYSYVDAQDNNEEANNNVEKMVFLCDLDNCHGNRAGS